MSAAQIEEVVGDYVTLRKRGANLIGLCPFHNEKTGSFTVSPSKGIYKCFGCGVAGNAVGFIMAIENCSYVEAIRHLARKYHIEIEERALTPEEQQRHDDRESMFLVNEYCAKWYQDQLWNTQEGQAVGLGYLRERGLTDETIRRFGIGFSPRGSALPAALKREGYVEKYMVCDPETGIGTGVCCRAADGRLFDRFSDRVIFPCQTYSGKTVSFAGRILRPKENVGKYVNSPESVIFKKKNELFGLFQAKEEIRRRSVCYLVEGQMDVISLHQAGIRNVVASGGTSLTQGQVSLIGRSMTTKNIVVLYDGDSAGIKAAIKGLDMFLREGFNAKVVLLPDGEDPDSFARTHNASDVLEYIEKHQTDFIRFKITLLQREAQGDEQAESALIHNVVASIACIPDRITRMVYIRSAASQLHREEKEIADYVESARRGQQAQPIQPATPATTPRTEEQSPLQRQAMRSPVAKSRIETNYENLLRLIIRYGERPLYRGEDGSLWTVADYILGQLEQDQALPADPLYARIIDLYRAHCHNEGFTAEHYFKTLPIETDDDKAVSRFAFDMLTDRYLLSVPTAEEGEKPEPVYNEEEQLPSLVPQFLLELKLTIAEQRIAEVRQQIREKSASGDLESLRPLMTLAQQLQSYRNEVCKQLGRMV